MKKSRPYRVATGGEDYLINFYEGTPFKFKKSNKDHTNFVTGVKYSPDNNHFVSVGFDKRVILYDGKSGDVVEQLADDKTSNNHTSAIITVNWVDNNTLVTGSLDKLVKVWKVKEKEIITLLTSTTPNRVEDIIAAVSNNDKYVICLTLDGRLHLWEISSLTDKKLPDKVIDGHQNYVSSVVYNSKLATTFSADTNGKIRIIINLNINYIVSWDANKVNKLVEPGKLKKVVNLVLTRDEDYLISLTSDPLVTVYDLTKENQQVFSVKLEGDAKCVRAINKDNIYVLFKRAIHVISEGKLAREVSLNYDATAFEVGNRGLFVGDSVIFSF